MSINIVEENMLASMGKEEEIEKKKRQEVGKILENANPRFD